jgi:hypothetical protein
MLQPITAAYRDDYAPTLQRHGLFPERRMQNRPVGGQTFAVHVPPIAKALPPRHLRRGSVCRFRWLAGQVLVRQRKNQRSCPKPKDSPPMCQRSSGLNKLQRVRGWSGFTRTIKEVRFDYLGFRVTSIESIIPWSRFLSGSAVGGGNIGPVYD